MVHALATWVDYKLSIAIVSPIKGTHQRVAHKFLGFVPGGDKYNINSISKTFAV